MNYDSMKEYVLYQIMQVGQVNMQCANFYLMVWLKPSRRIIMISINGLLITIIMICLKILLL